jgi:6-phosphogluconolactonase
MTRLTACPDAESAAERGAREIVRHLEEVRAQGRTPNIALTGGDTPQRTYEVLAREPEHWVDVEVWWGDERCVAPDDEQSNYRMAAEALLHPAGVAAERIHRMEGELGPDEGARRYGQLLRERIVGEPVPVFDLILLGIGPEGHVASLFPDAGTLQAGEQAVCLPVHDSPKPPPERITVSLAVLRAARRCMVLATGASKADAISAMLAEPTPSVPASLLVRERLTVIVDDAAAPAGGGPR